MSDKKISELTALTAPDGAEELVVNDSGTSKKITQANLLKGIDNSSADATAITIDASENVGLKTTPENYHTSYTGLDIGNGASIMGYGGNNGAWLLENSYLGTDGSWKYKNTSTAALYEMYGGVHNFYVAPSGTADTTISWTTPLTIANTGDVTVGTGNLVIGTSGKGIDFSATSDGSGTMTSEVLDDYEEGTWTPTPTQGITGGLSIVSASYTKIGRTVTWSMFINSFTGNTSNLYIGGLPFANQGSNGYSMQSNINSSANNATITNPHFRIEPSGSYLRALKNNDSSIIGTELDYSHIIASGTYQTD